MSEKKNKDEQERNSMKVPDDTQKRHSGGPVKDSKMIKQLWDEISKKDSRLQDLEKYISTFYSFYVPACDILAITFHL